MLNDKLTTGPVAEILREAFYTGEGRRAVGVKYAIGLLEQRDAKIAELEAKVEQLEGEIIERNELIDTLNFELTQAEDEFTDHLSYANEME